MKTRPLNCPLLILGLVVLNLETSVFGQPQPVSIPKLERSMRTNSISDLRIAEQSEDRTELTLVMQYEYNGNHGASALLLPIVDREDQSDVARWFGADMVTVPSGSAPVSIKVKFFNDEAGAPTSIETDRVRVLILNQNGSSIIGRKNLFRTVQWGSGDAANASASLAVGNREELIHLATEAEERARRDAKVAAEAEAEALKVIESTQNDLQKTEAQSIARKNAEMKAEAEARATEAALIRKEQKELLLAAEEEPAQEQTKPDLKTMITNVELLNRSRDRSRATLGVEIDLKDDFAFKPLIGVKIVSSDEAETMRFFKSTPVEVDKRKTFAMLSATLASTDGDVSSSILTDKVQVFLTDESGNEFVLLDTVTLPLTWRDPGAVEMGFAGGTLNLQEFRQRNSHTGYAMIKYFLPSGTGQLQVKLYDSMRPESASWFDTGTVSVSFGRGLELVPVRIDQSGGFPGGNVSVDTIQVELLAETGEVIHQVTRQTDMNWSKKKELAGK